MSEPAADERPPPSFDSARLEELRLAACSDPDFFAELLVSFATSVAEYAAGLRAAIGAGDRGAFTRVVHALKGSAASVGALALAAQAAALEAANKRGEMPAAAAIDRLAEEAERANRAARAWYTGQFGVKIGRRRA